jgi:hypothetical protein
MNREQAANYIGISPEELDKQRRAGEISTRWIGTKPVFIQRELDEYLESLPTEKGRS